MIALHLPVDHQLPPSGHPLGARHSLAAPRGACRFPSAVYRLLFTDLGPVPPAPLP
jgi:hypothetical protein